MSDTADRSELQSSPCMQGETVVFTGTLASVTHRKGQELVEQQGGRGAQHVSRHATLLVVGEEGWPLEPDGKPSQKLLQAKQLQEQGLQLRIINESDWLYAMGLNEHRQDVHRSYTPAMLSKLLDVPVSSIRKWDRNGLIRPVRRVMRLPYFDFQEVASARRLCELVHAGVDLDEIKNSLGHLEAVLGDLQRPLAQLNILAQDSHVVLRDEHGLVQPTTGQRMFDFDPQDEADSTEDSIIAFQSPPTVINPANVQVESSETYFREGCEFAEGGQLAAAIHAFRLCMMQVPGDPEVNFHLADALYRAGHPRAALERLFAAVESDHNYLEAWTQLGCLQIELREMQSALDAFSIAIELHPEFPDAHWHIASVYEELGESEQAREHWRTYLQFDSHGPWAESARQRLEGGTSEVIAAGEDDSR